jgi:cell division protein FtsL
MKHASINRIKTTLKGKEIKKICLQRIYNYEKITVFLLIIHFVTQICVILRCYFTLHERQIATYYMCHLKKNNSNIFKLKIFT